MINEPYTGPDARFCLCCGRPYRPPEWAAEELERLKAEVRKLPLIGWRYRQWCCDLCMGRHDASPSLIPHADWCPFHEEAK
jgi:hypothetical protein